MSTSFISRIRQDLAGIKAEPYKPTARRLHIPSGMSVGVLVIHGLTGMPNEMKPVAKKLEEIGCDLEVPMLRGHGGSQDKLLDTGWKDWVAGCRHVLDDLCRQCDTVIVGGLSMGGLIAVELAAENPKVSGIFALSPTICYDGQKSTPWGAFLPLVDVLPFLGKAF